MNNWVALACNLLIREKVRGLDPFGDLAVPKSLPFLQSQRGSDGKIYVRKLEKFIGEIPLKSIPPNKKKKGFVKMK